MSADIVNLRNGRPRLARRVTSTREVIRIGPTQSVSICASDAALIGTPLVELRCPSGEIVRLKPDQAEEIAAALQRGAEKARA